MVQTISAKNFEFLHEQSRPKNKFEQQHRNSTSIIRGFKSSATMQAYYLKHRSRI
jgi:hypothetical protein